MEAHTSTVAMTIMSWVPNWRLLRFIRPRCNDVFIYFSWKNGSMEKNFPATMKFINAVNVCTLANLTLRVSIWHSFLWNLSTTATWHYCRYLCALFRILINRLMYARIILESRKLKAVVIISSAAAGGYYAEMISAILRAAMATESNSAVYFPERARCALLDRRVFAAWNFIEQFFARGALRSVAAVIGREMSAGCWQDMASGAVQFAELVWRVLPQNRSQLTRWMPKSRRFSRSSVASQQPSTCPRCPESLSLSWQRGVSCERVSCA